MLNEKSLDMLYALFEEAWAGFGFHEELHGTYFKLFAEINGIPEQGVRAAYKTGEQFLIDSCYWNLVQKDRELAKNFMETAKMKIVKELQKQG